MLQNVPRCAAPLLLLLLVVEGSEVPAGNGDKRWFCHWDLLLWLMLLYEVLHVYLLLQRLL
jgi:hypothetical protein